MVKYGFAFKKSVAEAYLRAEGSYRLSLIHI